MVKNNDNDDEPIDFIPDDIGEKVDKLTSKKNNNNHDDDIGSLSEYDRVSFAHEIKKHPPEKDYMKVDIKPAVYSIDLNVDAHWWFSHVCTVFPLLLDQVKRTHIDLKDSFKAEKRLPDFNYMFIVVLFIGLIGVIAITKFFGWW